MKNEFQIKEQLENYYKNLELAKQEHLESAVVFITSAILNLRWVLDNVNFRIQDKMNDFRRNK